MITAASNKLSTAKAEIVSSIHAAASHTRDDAAVNQPQQSPSSNVNDAVAAAVMNPAGADDTSDDIASVSKLKSLLSHLPSSVATQVESVITRANADLKSRISHLESEMKHRVHKVEEEYERQRKQMVAQWELKRSELEEAASSLRAQLDQELLAGKQRLRARVIEELENRLEGLLDGQLLKLVQRSAIDPLMPRFIQQLVKDVIAGVWPDVKEEVLHAFHKAILKYEPIPEGTSPRPCPNIFRAAIASFLYHTYPYNRSIWWQVRQWSWWMWMVVAIFPLYGVQAAYFVCVFLLIDKKDEYQLVRFILSFKGLQFVTLGLMNCVIGAALYFQCVSVEYVGPITSMGSHSYLHTCDKAGPAALPGFYTDMILFAVQSITIWVAMALLPSSQKKGLRQLASNSPPRLVEHSALTTFVPTSRGLTGRVYGGVGGGKLRWMVLVDAWLVFIIVGVVILLLFTRPYDVTDSHAFHTYEWLFREDLFWLKTVYGLCSFPFVFFLTPGLSDLLLHTRPTGYNRAGQCVPKCSPDQEEQEENGEETGEAADAERDGDHDTQTHQTGQPRPAWSNPSSTTGKQKPDAVVVHVQPNSGRKVAPAPES